MKDKLIHKGVRLPESYWEGLKRLVENIKKKGQYTCQADEVREAIFNHLKNKGVFK